MATSNPVTLTSTINESDLELHDLLGRGNGGDVYRITWNSKQGEIEAAAKIIPIIKGKTNMKQLGNELNYHQKLKHPNIIEYYGQVVTPTKVIIVTEYAAKGSLYDYLKKVTHLPPRLKVQWAIEAARVVQYFRENNVLHRDIKSGNILITADNTLKICDFGTAKYLERTQKTSTPKGTIAWIPPEAFTENILSPKADIFAFGMMLWEMETCEEPYRGQYILQIISNVGTHDIRPEIPQSCSAAIRDLIKRCWDKDRSKRPEAEEIIHDLESIYGSSLPSASDQMTDTTPMSGTDEAIIQEMELISATSLPGASNQMTDTTPMGREVEDITQQLESTYGTRLPGASNQITYTTPMIGTDEDWKKFPEVEEIIQELKLLSVTSLPGASNQMIDSTPMGREVEDITQQLESTYETSLPGASNQMTYTIPMGRTDEGLQWRYKHEIKISMLVRACHWVDHQHLAVCTEGCVKVYEVTTEGSHLAYTFTSDEWKGEAIKGVAVSESMPNSILVICDNKPYVYQYPCHEATQQVKKYKIHGDEVNPWCIAANDNTAVIALLSGNTLVVCSLPDFTHQSHVQTSVDPCHLSITNDYLLVMDDHEMLVKPLSDLSQDLCRIQPPDGWLFPCVSLRNNARQIYAGCGQVDDKGCVYKYTWDGIGKPQYVNTGCVIDGLRWVGYLSVTSHGLLAIGECPQNVKVYSLE